MAQQRGVIEGAEAVWARIIHAVPTANPLSALTIIEAEAP